MFLRFTLFFLCASFTVLNAQSLTKIQVDTIRQTIQAQFGKAAAKGGLSKFNASVVVGQDTFYNSGGFNYLFQLKNGTAKRIDHCYFHGSNYNRFLFSHKDQIYQLGGYGLFITNNHLLRFSFLSNEWEVVKTHGQNPAFIQGITFLRNDSIFSFNNRRGGNGVEPDSIDPHLYVLELSSFTWQKLAEQTEFLDYSLNYETPDYLFLNKNHQYILFNKPLLKYEVLENMGEAFLKDEAQNNTGNLLYFSPTSSSLKTESTVLNLDSLWLRYKNKSQPVRYLSAHSEAASPSFPTLLYFIFSLLAILAIPFFRKKKASQAIEVSETAPIQERQTEKYYNNLIGSPRSVLTMEELDALLNIDYMEADSRKLRRYRLLQEITEAYPGLITRIKDEKDRRRFLYQINKPLSHEIRLNSAP